MAIPNPKEMTFERVYTDKFRALGAPHGVPIKYEQDVAAIDLGIHLTTVDEVTDSRVWFQLKGLHAATLRMDEFERKDQVAYEVKIEQLRTWYRSAEAVYLVLYIESADLFLAEDIREVVRRQWGDELLNDATFEPGQKTATVKIIKAGQVTDAFWQRLRRHRSMRVDGKKFRGRPLGHDLDPLRTTLQQMEPGLFAEVVRDLLAEHGYKSGVVLDASRLFPNADGIGNLASLECGVLQDKFEIVLQLMTELIPDEDGFRIEGPSEFVHGPCAVLIHRQVGVSPSVTGLRLLAEDLIRQRQITRFLVFVNAPLRGPIVCFGAYTEALAKTELRCSPQHLEDIAFNFLTTTATYDRFRDRVSYFGGKIWAKQQGPLFILSPDGGPLIPFS